MKTAIKSIYLVTALSLSALAAHADNTSNSPNTNTPTANTPAANTGNPSTTNTTAGTTASIVGNYSCKRVDASNTTNTYPLAITKTGDTYTFEWDDSTGNPTLYGTGVMHPSMANVVSTAFWDPKNTDTVGVEVFEIKPDGSLQSNWVLQNSDQLGSETCTKSK